MTGPQKSEIVVHNFDAIAVTSEQTAKPVLTPALRVESNSVLKVAMAPFSHSLSAPFLKQKNFFVNRLLTARTNSSFYISP